MALDICSYMEGNIWIDFCGFGIQLIKVVIVDCITFNSLSSTKYSILHLKISIKGCRQVQQNALKDFTFFMWKY